MLFFLASPFVLYWFIEGFLRFSVVFIGLHCFFGVSLARPFGCYWFVEGVLRLSVVFIGFT